MLPTCMVLMTTIMRGIWSSEELKFAKSKGYEITVIKGYQFNKVNNIFDDYINDLFNKKKILPVF